MSNLHPFFDNLFTAILNPGRPVLTNDEAMDTFRLHFPVLLTDCHVSNDGNMMVYGIRSHYSNNEEILEAANKTIRDYHLPLTAELRGFEWESKGTLVIRYL